MQLETDEKKLRKEILFTIKNQLGVRVGLFTPDMAFESIVKEQIHKLLNPSLLCVDMVSSELGNVIQKCAELVRERREGGRMGRGERKGVRGREGEEGERGREGGRERREGGRGERERREGVRGREGGKEGVREAPLSLGVLYRSVQNW